MRLTFFRSKQRTTSSSDEQHQKEYSYQNKKKKTKHFHHNHHYHHHHHTNNDHDNYTPQHYFHSLKANGALVLHRQLQRRSSMDEILDVTGSSNSCPNNIIIGTPQPSKKYKKIPTTWSPATAPSPLLSTQQQYSATHTASTQEDSDEADEQGHDNRIQQRRQELLRYYLSQHQQRSSKLLMTQEENYNNTNTMVIREEKLEREVRHLKRMVTLLRDIVLSSTSSSPSLENSFDSSNHQNTNDNYDNNSCNGDTISQHNSDSNSNNSYYTGHRHDSNDNNQHSQRLHREQEPNGHNSAAAVTYERKLQILFQEIGALHKEQESSAMRYRELQQRHDELCTKLREKDEMVSCLQSDLRALMINTD